MGRRFLSRHFTCHRPAITVEELYAVTMLTLLAILLLLIDVTENNDANFEGDDDGQSEHPSKPVLHASLIMLQNMDINCALKATEHKYPLR